MGREEIKQLVHKRDVSLFGIVLFLFMYYCFFYASRFENKQIMGGEGEYACLPCTWDRRNDVIAQL